MSTALPEEAMAECLKKSIYESIVSKDEDVYFSGDKDDVKCSICQVFFSLLATALQIFIGAELVLKYKL